MKFCRDPRNVGRVNDTCGQLLRKMSDVRVVSGPGAI